MERGHKPPKEEKMENYKGYTITLMTGGCTVFEQGDEIYFDSVAEAKAYIDSLEV